MESFTYMSFTGSLMTDKDCTGLQFDAEEIKLRKHIKYSNRDEFFLTLHVKHNIIQMSHTVTLTGPNSFEVIFYYYSAYFRQYLDNRIRNVVCQLLQSSKIYYIYLLYLFIHKSSE